MSASEIYTLINESVDILAWPGVAVILAAMFRGPITSLLSRFAQLEGTVGGLSFKVSLENYLTSEMTKALELEKNERSNEARAVVKNASDVASVIYGLSEADIAHLTSLAEGASPPSRWGKVHLVRAGLVELDGGQLTPHGKEIFESFIRPYIGSQERK